MDITIVILAAGKGSRMGNIKQLLPYKDSNLLQHVIYQALNSKGSRVYCVLGANANIILKTVIGEQVTFIHNPNWESGLSSSIVVAVNHFKNLEKFPSAVLVMLADQPNVGSNFINELIDLYQINENQIIASAYGNKNGVPAIFPNLYFEDLLNLKGDKGARLFLKSNQENVLAITPEYLEILNDIDSQEDYENLIKNESL